MTNSTARQASDIRETDILIIGSGAAGLTLALRCANFARITVISKGSLREGATFYAQGGIAAVLDHADSIQAHVADTLVAGVGLCHEDMVEFVVRQSTECVRWLVDQGVPFTTKTRAPAVGSRDGYHRTTLAGRPEFTAPDQGGGA